MKEIEEFLKYSDLYHTYGSLLSKKQREYLDEFLDKDNTFSEIAQAMNISRQAVFDNIKKACAKLDKFEEELKILEKDRMILKKLKEIRKNLNLEKLEELINEIEGS